MLPPLKKKMRRSTTETKTNRAERPKVVTREGKDKVTKTEVDVTKVTRNVGFYAASQHLIGLASLQADIKLKAILAEFEKAKTLTPKIKRKLEAWSARANAARAG